VSEASNEFAGELEPQGVTYEMEDNIQRIRFTLGRTTLTLEGPPEEADNGTILIEGAKDLLLQAFSDLNDKGHLV
jgi:hypothetical protein